MKSIRFPRRHMVGKPRSKDDVGVLVYFDREDCLSMIRTCDMFGLDLPLVVGSILSSVDLLQILYKVVSASSEDCNGEDPADG